MWVVEQFTTQSHFRDEDKSQLIKHPSLPEKLTKKVGSLDECRGSIMDGDMAVRLEGGCHVRVHVVAASGSFTDPNAPSALFYRHL